MQTLIAATAIALTATSAMASEFGKPAEPAAELLKQIQELDGKTFEGTGLLKRSWLEFSGPSYVLLVGNQKYNVKLDDGRSVSQRAETCEKEEFIGFNAKEGCLVSFTAQYDIDPSDGGVSVRLTAWGVTFLDGQ